MKINDVSHTSRTHSNQLSRNSLFVLSQSLRPANPALQHTRTTEPTNRRDRFYLILFLSSH
jgi:hypothetical protein